MLSRAADNLYWMSRYLERAEHTARVTGVHFNLMLERDPATEGARWSRVLASLGCTDPVEDDDAFAAAQVYAQGQIFNSIACARENARQVREQISSEMWEDLNRLFHESKRMGKPEFWNSRPHDLLYNVTQSSHTFQGITDSTMIHGEGWQFIQVGRFMERVQATACLIDLHFGEFFREGSDVNALDHVEWIGLLRSCTAFEAYCKVYTADLRPERVAEFLLMNSEFPHSVRFAVDHLRRSLEAVHSTTVRKSDRLNKLAGRLTSALSYTPLEEIMANLHEFSATIRRLCADIHAGIYQIYISYPIDAALES
jgi:uncharacterized alpha-E superfamily protein